MDAFQYKAINIQGRMLRGKLDAVNEADLEVRLGRMGLDLVSYKQVRATGTNVSGKGVTRLDLITFTFHLEQLVRAGVPILEGLADLRDSVENPRLREVTAAIIESIEGGKTLSAAMKDFPVVFDNVFISLISVGEETGQLAKVLDYMTESLKWQDEQAAQTKKLLMYPAFVGTIVSAVVIFLMTYVVPELLSFVTSMGKELPAHTKVLIWVSNAMVNYWYLVISIPVVIVVSVIAAARVSPSVAYRLDDMKLHIPVIGPILKKITLARFANFFAIMYTSGVTVIDSIRIGQGVVGNLAVENAIEHAGQQIADGAGISSGFESSGLFPPLVIRMLRVGENTGALDEALQNVSYFYTRDIKESVEKLQTMIEPAMTMILGAILAWVMFSVLGPIYDLITQLKF